MNLAWLRASRRTWGLKVKFCQRKRDFFRSHSKRPLKEREAKTAKWQKDLDHARYMVSKRNRQIVSKNRENLKKAAATSGVTKFDGVPVAAVAVPYLQWARDHGWTGKLVSGWRDPKYSESLCYRICGRPHCPGICAGTTSNHVGTTATRFAVDVSDYGTFKAVIARCPIKPHIFNNLPRDPVHFSPNGQ